MDGFLSRVFEKEANFYKNLVPALNEQLHRRDQPSLRVPKCYYFSLETKKEIIFLQDMRHLKYKMFDRKLGLDKAHTFLVLEELARMHAASALLASEYGTDDLETKFDFLKDFYTNSGQATEEMIKQFFQSSLESGAAIAEKLGNYETIAQYMRKIGLNVLETFKKEMEILLEKKKDQDEQERRKREEIMREIYEMDRNIEEAMAVQRWMH